MGDSTDGFLTNSNASAPGSVQTQSISVEESDSDTLLWGGAFETTSLAVVGGVKVGFTLSAEYNGSHTTTTTKGNEYSGAVMSFPAGTPADYTYNWKLVAYNAKLNGSKVPVVGYLTKSTTIAPPSIAQNITVEDVKDTSVTLTWEDGHRVPDYYKVSKVAYNASGVEQYFPLPGEIRSVDGKCSYTINDIQHSNTSYYVIESYKDNGKKNVATEVISVTTLPEGFAVLSKIDGEKDDVIYQDGTELTASLTISGNEHYDTYYQWQLDNGNGWENITNQTGKKLNFAISTLDHESRIRCASTIFVGDHSYQVYSNPITLHCARTVEGYSVDWAEDGSSVIVTANEDAVSADIYVKADNADGSFIVVAPETASDNAVTYDLTGLDTADICVYIWDGGLTPVTYPFVR